MTNRIEDANNRRIRQGRKLVWQQRWLIWVDHSDCMEAVACFWMEDFGSHEGHPEVEAAKAEYGPIYSVRLAKRGEPA